MKKNLSSLGLLFSLAALPSAAWALNFGYIDTAKMQANYNEMKKVRSMLEGEKAKLQTTLDAKKKDVGELDKEMADLAQKLTAARDGKKDKEAASLEGQMRTKREALVNADGELRKFFEDSQKRLLDLEEEKMGTLYKALDEKLDEVVKKVATSKGLEAVFEKRMCFYGGVDVTDEVVAQLNAGTSAPAAAPAAPAKKPGDAKRAGTKPGN